MKAFMAGLAAGVIVGGILITMAGRVIDSRRDPWPDAVMVVIDHDFKALRQASSEGTCATPETGRALQRLQLTAQDIELALMGDGDDRVFRQYANDLRGALGKLSDAGSDCPKFAEAIVSVRGTCQACHRDYR